MKMLRSILRLAADYMRELILFPSSLFLVIFLLGGLYTYAILITIFIVLVFLMGDHLGKKLEEKFKDKRNAIEHDKQDRGNSSGNQ